jgi:hypothetical protein
MNPNELRSMATYAGLEISEEDARAVATLLGEYHAEIQKLRELVLPDDLEPVVHYAIEPWS